MTPGERIKELRAKNGISQKQLSHDLGYKTYTTVSKWESDASLPPGKELKKLAEYFQVSTDYILGLDDSPNNTYRNDENSNEILFLESLNPNYLREEHTTRTIKVPRYILKESISSYFVLNVHTDSMNRLIPNGNKVVILDFSLTKDDFLKTGDIVILKYQGEYRLKYLRKADTMIYLEPHSYLEGFSTLTFTKEEFDKIEIVGKVVYTFRTFS